MLLGVSSSTLLSCASRANGGRGRAARCARGPTSAARCQRACCSAGGPRQSPTARPAAPTQRAGVSSRTAAIMSSRAAASPVALRAPSNVPGSGKLLSASITALGCWLIVIPTSLPAGGRCSSSILGGRGLSRSRQSTCLLFSLGPQCRASTPCSARQVAAQAPTASS